jgi:uncharacterized phage-associated protein/DNA-binding XRE family transcriptional regulator
MTQTIHAAVVDVQTFESPAAARRARLTPEARAFGEEVGRRIDFRNQIRDLRLSLRLTQAQVAEIVGDEDQADISRFEHGKGNPTLDRMEKILGRLAAYAAEKRREAESVAHEPTWTQTALVPAQAAAQYLCAIRDEEDSFTNLKLQKLLYYAQAYAAVLLRRPLFRERIKAWTHGPVVPQVRYEYKEHQAQPLPRPEGFDPLSLDPVARAVLERVYVELGQYEAWHLRDMTHSEEPWTSTARGDEITLDSIRAYFEPRLRSAPGR